LPAAADSAEPWELAFQRVKVDEGMLRSAPAAADTNAGAADGANADAATVAAASVAAPAAPPSVAAPAAPTSEVAAAAPPSVAAPAAPTSEVAAAAPPSEAHGTAGDTAGDAAASSVSPRSVPALDFAADDLSWLGWHFGAVHAVLGKHDDGVTLDALTTVSPSFKIDAHGGWRGRDSGIGRISGALTSTDVKATLTQLGYADVISAKSGHVNFDLAWVGAPTADALREMTGRVQVAMEKGQLLGVKPGAGRVLGLASIAALPRRLALDFSDLTEKGLAFDTAHGDFEFIGGNAYTDDSLIKGPAAEIGIIGRIGIKAKDYDQTAEVTGSISNTLPIAGALAGGPVVGAAVLLFTQVFKQPLNGLTRAYYRITGGWDNPTVERISSAGAAATSAEVPK
jgi:uncharacterized protein YhdP